MDVARSSEKLVSYRRTTRGHNPEGLDASLRRKNLKSRRAIIMIMITMVLQQQQQQQQQHVGTICTRAQLSNEISILLR
jgi:hypothetical protein